MSAGEFPVVQHLVEELVHCHDAVEAEVTQGSALHFEQAAELALLQHVINMRGDDIVHVLRKPYLSEILVRGVRAKEFDRLQNRREIRVIQV